MDEETYEFDRRRFRGQSPVLMCVLCALEPATVDDMVCDDCKSRIKEALSLADDEAPIDRTVISMFDWKASHGRN